MFVSRSHYLCIQRICLCVTCFLILLGKLFWQEFFLKFLLEFFFNFFSSSPSSSSSPSPSSPPYITWSSSYGRPCRGMTCRWLAVTINSATATDHQDNQNHHEDNDAELIHPSFAKVSSVIVIFSVSYAIEANALQLDFKFHQFPNQNRSV